MLTREEVEEFKKITFETKGLKLNDEQALDQGIRLVILFDLILKNEQPNRSNTVASYEAKEENK
jgi:hypothetical protein